MATLIKVLNNLADIKSAGVVRFATELRGGSSALQIISTYHNWPIARTSPPTIPRRLGCADHHEPRRVGADPALEGKARGNRARGSKRQPYRPTGRRHRASEPDLVRAQCWAGGNGRSALGSAPCPSVLGGDPGRVRKRPRRRIRGQ